MFAFRKYNDMAISSEGPYNWFRENCNLIINGSQNQRYDMFASISSKLMLIFSLASRRVVCSKSQFEKKD